MGPPSESEEEAGMVGRVDEDEEGAAATFAPGTGPAHRATPTCLRPRPSAFGAAHPGQVTEGPGGVVVVVVGGEQEVGRPKVQVGGTSLRASKRRGLPERYMPCSRPSNRRANR